MGPSQEHELGGHRGRLRAARLRRSFRFLAGAILLWSAGHPWGGPRVAFSQAAALPRGDGAELVLGRCTICHSMDAPSLPRQDHGAWTETVDRMVRWGAPIPREERETIIRYLVVHFGAVH